MPTEFLAAADLERFIRFDSDIARLESTFNGLRDVPRMFDELARSVELGISARPPIEIVFGEGWKLPGR